MPKTAKAAPGRRARNAAATRRALITTARKMFGELGYTGTGTEDLVSAAGVTRGALYYHFVDKEDLFLAVFREVAGELDELATRQNMRNASDPRRLQRGLSGFLKLISADSEVRRILLLDGPAVFGWARWREIEGEFTFGPILNALEIMMDSGAIQRRDPKPLGRLLQAALFDAALSIAHADDREKTLAEMSEAIHVLMSGLYRTD